MPDDRRHRSGGGVWRAPIILVIAALLVAGGLIDRTHSASSGAAPAPAAASPQPYLASAGALSSSWFCAGATDNSGGQAPGELVITNAGSGSLEASITLVPSAGASVVHHVAVAALGRTTVPETVTGGAPWIGAVVDLNGGQASVEQQINSSLGVSSTPCATSGSTQWYFASGETLINASTEITLLNPYPSLAIVDLSFTTNEGVEQPSAFRGLEVPADGLITVNLGAHLRLRQFIATTLTTRTGRVVAWKTSIVTTPPAGAVLIGSAQAKAGAGAGADPYAAQGGVTVTLGASSPANRWSWPDGVAGNGVNEQYVIYNPGAGTARVRLSLELAEGSAEPFSLSVGPDSVTTLDAGSEARIPAGVAHSAELTTTNGIPVVAERVVTASSPSTRVGLGELFGSRLSADNWLFGAGAVTSTQDEWVVLFNPGSTTVHADFDGMSDGAQTPLRGLTGVPVRAGARVAVDIGAHDSKFDGAVIVRASGPIVAERDLYGTGSTPGMGLAIGVPFS